MPRKSKESCQTGGFLTSLFGVASGAAKIGTAAATAAKIAAAAATAAKVSAAAKVASATKAATTAATAAKAASAASKVSTAIVPYSASAAKAALINSANVAKATAAAQAAQKASLLGRLTALGSNPYVATALSAANLAGIGYGVAQPIIDEPIRREQVEATKAMNAQNQASYENAEAEKINREKEAKNREDAAAARAADEQYYKDQKAALELAKKANEEAIKNANAQAAAAEAERLGYEVMVKKQNEEFDAWLASQAAAQDEALRNLLAFVPQNTPAPPPVYTPPPPVYTPPAAPKPPVYTPPAPVYNPPPVYTPPPAPKPVVPRPPGKGKGKGGAMRRGGSKSSAKEIALLLELHGLQ